MCFSPHSLVHQVHLLEYLQLHEVTTCARVEPVSAAGWSNHGQSKEERPRPWVSLIGQGKMSMGEAAVLKHLDGSLDC